ncbi:beta-lactamase/transpeptidase-like protein [Thozetella sp. PMI_491]|nr:beta-lactamase/transpeptidase-like protein [Thozetella sp. PMI_491]
MRQTTGLRTLCAWLAAPRSLGAAASSEAQSPLHRAASVPDLTAPLVAPKPDRKLGLDLSLDSFDAFIEDTIQKWHLPGISIAIVKGNATVFKLPDKSMTPETLFYCGSTTKSFTAAAMSLLVDDEAFPQVQWTTPMSRLLPDDFVLSDDWATDHITIEDTLSHRTGYPSHNLGINNTSPLEAVRRLRHLPMSAEPRTRYQYSNYMFTAVGHLVEVLTGQWLGDFFRARLWEPLGMHQTYLAREDAEASGLPLATEYRWHNDSESFAPVAHLPNGRGREGAGMVISNVVDYAQYLRAMMTEAAPLSKAAHAAIRMPRTIQDEGSLPYTGPLCYGFGWSGGVIHDERFWFHNGQIREHVSQMWMFPDREFALVTLANAESDAPEIIAWKIIYDVLGVPSGKRWDTEAAVKARVERRAKALETCVSRLYPPHLSSADTLTVPLRSFTGTFQDAGYGDVTIFLECPAEDPFPEGATPVNPTRERGCFLRTESAMGLEGRSFHLVFEHVSGDDWLGWGVVDEEPADGHTHQHRDQQRPAICMRAEFRLDNDKAILSRIFCKQWIGSTKAFPLIKAERYADKALNAIAKIMSFRATEYGRGSIFGQLLERFANAEVNFAYWPGMESQHPTENCRGCWGWD